MKKVVCVILIALLILSIPTSSLAGYTHCDYHPNAPKIWHDEINYVNDISDSEHRKVWSNWYTCSVCNDYIGTGGDIYREETEPHTFSGNTCTLCGYRRANSLPTPEQLQTAAIQLINKHGDEIIGRNVKILYAGNVRAKASQYSADIGSVFVDEEYEIISYAFGSSTNIWLEIKYRNSYGWISASLVQMPSITGGGGKWLIGLPCRITTSSGRARLKAGTEYPIVEYVGYNEEYTILDIDYASDGNLWFQIQKDGNLCWISSGIATTNK